MNNIVKIILGLNIAAGGAGIFFGITKSGKVDEIKQAKMDAEGKAQSAVSKEQKLLKEKNEALTAVSTKDGEITNLKTQITNLETTADNSQERIDQAVEAMKTAQAAAQSANTTLIQVQEKANQVPGLEAQVANLEAEKQILEDKIKSKRRPTSEPAVVQVKKATDFGEVGAIQSHDPTLGFYVINAGKDNGIKVGDKYSVFSGTEAVGYIEITRVQPSVSIAISQKGKPKPTVPFKNGDKIMKGL